MSELVFGIDFGTTNSLAALVIGKEIQALTNEEDDKPHPSIVWYRGADVVVGREARKHIESLEGGVAHGFVRSPKMALRRDGPIHVDGRAIDPTDVVSEVLRHIKENAASRSDRSYNISRAVMTIPVDFAGPQRRALRAAARKAGIGVVQFVHEPAAALYAYLRAKPDLNRELSRFENRVVLVFDWGGGTLDLTVCKVLGGVVMQIANRGSNDVGGDRFDERLRNWIRDKHALRHELSDISALEQPGTAASLLAQCELAKIALSQSETFIIILKDYLRGDGPERNLAVNVTKHDIENLSRDLVNHGLAEIDRLLDDARLNRSDIEICLATGGMVNMPVIWNGLVERFGARVPALPNRDRIIAEGAAWIARDDLRLTLSKPIEVLVASGGDRGVYQTLVPAGLTLPVENKVVAADNRRFFCVDPRDGMAVFEFAKPRKVGLVSVADARSVLCSLNLPIDPGAPPFRERLECELKIDHDYVAQVFLRSCGRSASVEAEIHDLDFGLALPVCGDERNLLREEPNADSRDILNNPSDLLTRNRESTSDSNVVLRSNVSDIEEWRQVPGDLAERWKPEYFENRSQKASEDQLAERMYYYRCTRCDRNEYQIRTEGANDICRQYRCSEFKKASRKRARS